MYVADRIFVESLEFPYWMTKRQHVTPLGDACRVLAHYTGLSLKDPTLRLHLRYTPHPDHPTIDPRPHSKRPSFNDAVFGGKARFDHDPILELTKANVVLFSPRCGPKEWA